MISKYDTLKKDIFRLNEDEEFYKAYYRAGHSSEGLKEFLSQIDKGDATRRHLVIPELLTEIISYEMNDEEYFKLYLCIMGLVRKISEQTENIFRMAM